MPATRSQVTSAFCPRIENVNFTAVDSLLLDNGPAAGVQVEVPVDESKWPPYVRVAVPKGRPRNRNGRLALTLGNCYHGKTGESSFHLVHLRKEDVHDQRRATVAKIRLARRRAESRASQRVREKMKAEILHNVFGSITLDDDGQITVRKPDLAERLTYLMAHFDELGAEVQHYGAGELGRLIATLEYMGLAGGITKVTSDEEEPPEGATL